MYAKDIKPVSDKNNHIVEHHHQHHHHCCCCRLPHMLGVCVSLLMRCTWLALQKQQRKQAQHNVANEKKIYKFHSWNFAALANVDVDVAATKLHLHTDQIHTQSADTDSERAREQSLKSLLLLLSLSSTKTAAAQSLHPFVWVLVLALVLVMVSVCGACSALALAGYLLLWNVSYAGSLLSPSLSVSLLVCTCNFCGGQHCCSCCWGRSFASSSSLHSQSCSIVALSTSAVPDNYMQKVLWLQFSTHRHTHILWHLHICIFVNMCTLWFIMRVQQTGSVLRLFGPVASLFEKLVTRIRFPLALLLNCNSFALLFLHILRVYVQCTTITTIRTTTTTN